MMDVSISTVAAVRRYGAAEAARRIRAAGFEAVDYAAHDLYKADKGLFTLPDKEFYAFFEAERRVFEDAGLAFGQVHCCFNPPPDRIPASEKPFFFASVKRSIRATAVLGAPVAVIHPFIDGETWYENPQLSLDITERVCAEYIEVADQVGVKVALENLPPAPKVPYSVPEHYVRLFEKLDSPTLGACLDTGHANWSNAGPVSVPDIARTLGKRLYCLHMQDNVGTWDNHSIPFEGTVAWNELCRALAEIGYTGSINLETGLFRDMSDALFDKALAYQCEVARELRDKLQAARAALTAGA